VIRNVELIWLLCELRPNFRCIADFHRDDRAELRAVFWAFLIPCRKLDLFGRELLAVDGTRPKASNNGGRNLLPREADQVFCRGPRAA